MKTLTINKEKWIKKIHYDRLEKSKIKKSITKEEIRLNDLSPSNPSNTLAVVSMNNLPLLISKLPGIKSFKVTNEEPRFLQPNEHMKNNIPRIKYKNTVYSYEYFLQALEIANAMGCNRDYDVLMTEEKGQPCLLQFGNMGVIIAPRIDEDSE